MSSPAIDHASEIPGFLDELRDILSQADAAIAQKSPLCKGCGKCCDFAKMGHRLYVSTGELALLSSIPPPKSAKPLQCPYQINGQCKARDRRPLGCRVYFCESNLAEDFYERFHDMILDSHKNFAVPYRYVELTSALAT